MSQAITEIKQERYRFHNRVLEIDALPFDFAENGIYGTRNVTRRGVVVILLKNRITCVEVEVSELLMARVPWNSSIVVDRNWSRRDARLIVKSSREEVVLCRHLIPLVSAAESPMKRRRLENVITTSPNSSSEGVAVCGGA